MTENQKPELTVVEDIELSEQDQIDLAKLSDTPVDYHTLLQVWSAVLKPAAEEATKRVTPQWAMRMVQSYPGISLQDMNDFRDRFYGKIAELGKILEFEIETDPDALQHLTKESDAEENRTHYLNLLLNWQKAVLLWELEWDCTDPKANIEVAAISEVHKMFFGQQGLTTFLDNIGFQFDETDGNLIAEELEALKEGHE